MYRLEEEIRAVKGTVVFASYFHEEDVIPLGRSQNLLHLPGVHGQRLLAQHILLGVHKEQTSAQMEGVDNSNIHHICTHIHTHRSENFVHCNRKTLKLTVNWKSLAIYQRFRFFCFIVESQPEGQELTNIWISGQLLIAAICSRDAVLPGKLLCILQFTSCHSHNLEIQFWYTHFNKKKNRQTTLPLGGV